MVLRGLGARCGRAQGAAGGSGGFVVPWPARVPPGLRAPRERLPALSFPLGPRQEPLPEQRWLLPVPGASTELCAPFLGRGAGAASELRRRLTEPAQNPSPWRLCCLTSTLGAAPGLGLSALCPISARERGVTAESANGSSECSLPLPQREALGPHFSYPPKQEHQCMALIFFQIEETARLDEGRRGYFSGRKLQNPLAGS